MIAPEGALVFHEKAWNAYPYCRTSKFQLNHRTMHALLNENLSHQFLLTVHSSVVLSVTWNCQFSTFWSVGTDAHFLFLFFVFLFFCSIHCSCDGELFLKILHQAEIVFDTQKFIDVAVLLLCETQWILPSHLVFLQLDVAIPYLQANLSC